MRLFKSFFIALICCFGTLLYFECANAGSHSCDNYKFYNDGCTDCMPGCYCQHNGTVYDIDWPFSGIRDKEVEAWCSSGEKCPDAGKSDDRGTYGDCGRSGMAGIYKCPSGFPKSAAKATSIEQCYTEVGSTKLYYKKITCLSGEYLPINSDKCATCKTGANDVCLGIKDVYPSISKDQGLSTCSSGKTPDPKHSICITKGSVSNTLATDSPVTASSVKASTETTSSDCIPGEYLPANSTSCQPCKSDKVCLGGTFKKASIDQGLTSCPKGQKPNENNTECIDGGAITVIPGYYLPAGSVEQKACNNARKFCPGGEYMFSTFDQGQYDCPAGGTVSADKRTCTLVLDETQMRCGIKGVKSKGSEECASDTPCWMMSDTEDYVNCILGDRIQMD